MPFHRSELLTGLDEADAAAILALGKPVCLAAGEVLFNLGDEARCLYLVRSGQISLTLPMQIGGQQQDVFIEERVPGQALGWSALIPPWRFTLHATAPLQTELLALPRGALLAHFAERPDVGQFVALNIATLVGRRLQVVQAMWLRQMQHLVDAHV
jgi:CRP-like cAMP-binding protein